MQSIGLPSNPTLEDLLQLNSTFFNYQDSVVSETMVFGVPALQVKTISDTGPEIVLMGFLNEEAFLLSFGAPTEETLVEFLPIWDAVVASVKPLKGK